MVQLSDHGSLLRARGGGAERVTPLELFFDLVYVFAVTQLSHRLLDHLSVGGALETLLLVVVVWSDIRLSLRGDPGRAHRVRAHSPGREPTAEQELPAGAGLVRGLWSTVDH